MVNKKFIVPGMTSYDAQWPTAFVKRSYSSHDTMMQDVIKALCYITGENYDAIPDIRQFLYDNEVQWGTWFNWAFFRVKAFKKGTMHFEFLDEKVWTMFNQAVAEQRGWVLPKKRKK